MGRLHLSNDSRLPLREARLEWCPPALGVLERIGSERPTARAYVVVDPCTLEPGWQRRVRFLDAVDVPAKVVYRADWESSRQEVRRYLLADLRQLPIPAALPQGNLEVYELVDGRRVPVTRGELTQAVDRETEIPLGTEPNIVYERTLLDWRKTDVQFDRIGRVSGYDTHEDIRCVLRNRLPFAVDLELIERVPGVWEFAGRVPPARREANEMRWDLRLPPDGRAEIHFTITRRIGSRAG